MHYCTKSAQLSKKTVNWKKGYKSCETQSISQKNFHILIRKLFQMGTSNLIEKRTDCFSLFR